MSKRALKPAATLIAVMASLSAPAYSQTMSLEEMQAELQAMQVKMQEMQAMQIKMEEMQRELDLLRQRDANRESKSNTQVASSQDTGGETAPGSEIEDSEHGLDAAQFTGAETKDVLATMPMAAMGRGERLNDPDFVKSAPLFGSDFRFSIGGYAKTDLIFDFDGVGDPYQFVLGEIPVNDSPQGGSYSKLHIRESRTHLEIRNVNSPHKTDKFFLEFDFYDGKDSTNFRLRHAYMQYGQFLAGRTWSIITELRALPLILDFAAGDAILGGRS